LKNYCGSDLRCCRSLKSSTYSEYASAFSFAETSFPLACALHIGLLVTIFNNLVRGA